MRKVLNTDIDLVYPMVLSGEFKILENGEIWRYAKRLGIGVGKTRLINIEPQRAEINSGEYLRISVMINKKKYALGAHRLVYYHFNGKIPYGLTVNHKNGNKKDNRPENLELLTYSENIKHAIHVLGTIGIGSKCRFAKLNEKRVLEIRRRKWETMDTDLEIANDYGVCKSTVSLIVARKIWQHI